MDKADFILTPTRKGKLNHDEITASPASRKVICTDELNRIKGNMFFSNEILLIEYLGDLYFYRKKSSGNSICYEYSYTVTFD